MEYNKDKVDEMTLALLYLVNFKERDYEVARAWKGFDWDTMDRLHQKGWISNPKGKAKSVSVTEEGAKRSEQLFELPYINHAHNTRYLLISTICKEDITKRIRCGSPAPLRRTCECFRSLTRGPIEKPSFGLFFPIFNISYLISPTSAGSQIHDD